MSMFNPALLVMQPREIPEVVRSLQNISIDTYCFKGFNEPDVCVAINQFILEQKDKYTHYIISADDIIYDLEPSNSVLKESLKLSTNNIIITGWCNLYLGSKFSNVSIKPLTLSGASGPKIKDYTFQTINNILEQKTDAIFPTYLISFCFSCIPKNILLEYPMMTYPNKSSSDHNFSYRYYNTSLNQTPVQHPTPYGFTSKNMFFKHLKPSKRSYRQFWIVGQKEPHIMKIH